MNSGQDENRERIDRLAWRKSSLSNGTGGNCVEVALLDGDLDARAAGAAHKAGDGPLIALRDSKDPDGPRLYFTRSEFAAFRHGLVAGEFDDLT
ncbi:DUF397 domain-containing protein [Nonomuraea cavernae]|uniref:DUF397 domain-containing protein n=1 Tax=Nonomuraea cavernae TaxID=2045107 RepID=A0A917Z6Q9_9ACTN|nr:DUF397 domain-containing protein [Nonomuraea cavernae]MCA2188656.1 DUF397 domain-containing protein [Nonomuraea cavernae]GGO74383.1 DUF397 domain-containing protein [Nonomuraea cavernae]